MQSLPAASHLHYHQNLNLPANTDFINIWAFQVTKTWTWSKGKMSFGHMMKAYTGVEVALFSFLTLALDETTGQLYALAAPCLPTPLPPHRNHRHHHHQKQPSVPTEGEDGWTPELIWMLWRKANILARNWTIIPVVQPVALSLQRVCYPQKHTFSIAMHVQYWLQGIFCDNQILVLDININFSLSNCSC